MLYFLGNVQWLDAFDGQFEEALERLAEVIRQTADYPAEETKLYRSTPPRADVALASTRGRRFSAGLRPFPVAPPAPERPKLKRESSPVVALCVVIALARMASSAPSAQARARDIQDGRTSPGFDGREQTAESEARAAAERFLNYRDSGDYQLPGESLRPKTKRGRRSRAGRKGPGVDQEVRATDESHLDSCTPGRRAGFTPVWFRRL